MLPLMVFGVTGDAVAASCTAGANTITFGSGGCDVDGVNAVTTVLFQGSPSITQDPLILKNNAPSGAVTTDTNNRGTVQVETGTTTSANTFGVGGAGPIILLQVGQSTGTSTFNLGHDLNTANLGLGGGSTEIGILNQSAGTITTPIFTIVTNSSFTQSGSGILNVGAGGILLGFLGPGATLTLVNQGTGTINGINATEGALIFAGDYNTDATIGGVQPLASITVNDGQTLTLDQNASATTFTVGQGTTGILNHSAGTVTRPLRQRLAAPAVSLNPIPAR